MQKLQEHLRIIKRVSSHSTCPHRQTENRADTAPFPFFRFDHYEDQFFSTYPPERRDTRWTVAESRKNVFAANPVGDRRIIKKS